MLFCLTSKAYLMLTIVRCIVNPVSRCCFKCASSDFSDIPRHLGRPARRRAKSGCAPIPLEVCRTPAVSPLSFRLQLCLPLQLGNITFPTWVNEFFPLLSTLKNNHITDCFTMHCLVCLARYPFFLFPHAPLP